MWELTPVVVVPEMFHCLALQTGHLGELVLWFSLSLEADRQECLRVGEDTVQFKKKANLSLLHTWVLLNPQWALLTNAGH